MQRDKPESYRDLKTWQIAMSLAESCYRCTKTFPRDELFGLTSQIRRAASSVPANIAEGYGRDSLASYIHFLRIAQGSLKELETHIILANRIELLATENAEKLLSTSDEVGRMFRGLIKSLHNREHQKSNSYK